MVENYKRNMPTSYHPSPFSCSLKHSSIHRFLFWNFFFFDYFFLCLLNVVSNRYVIFKLATKGERYKLKKKIKSSKVSSDHSRWLEQTYFFVFELPVIFNMRTTKSYSIHSNCMIFSHCKYTIQFVVVLYFYNPSFLYIRT